MTSQQDKIYAQATDKVEDFQFDNKVAGVFNDMIRRSVPGYSQIIHSIGDFAARFVTPQSHVYDLGSSLGSATLSIRRKIEGRQCKIIAVDNSQSMIDRCKENLAAYVSDTQVDLVCGDIRTVEFSNASLVVLNFTLQFLPVDDRDTLIKQIYDGMLPGGMLVISEKLRFEDAPIQTLLDELHLNFKRANGYSELEISQKRSALENVMRPDTLKIHQSRLEQCGFTQFSTWYQCFNFASMVAIK